MKTECPSLLVLSWCAQSPVYWVRLREFSGLPDPWESDWRRPSVTKKNGRESQMVLPAPSFSTLKEGTFEIGTCPELRSDSNWSIKCWQSIMYLGRWNRLTYWRHIVFGLVDASKTVTSSYSCSETVCPEGEAHRMNPDFTAQGCF